MIASPKLFLDSCIASPLTARLLHHYRPAHPALIVRHLHELYRADEDDSVWIPRVAKEGGWIIVTKDGARRQPRWKPRLPDLCIEYKVTCVVFTGGEICNGKVAIQQEALDEIMRNIQPIYKAPPGTVIRLGTQTRRGNIKVYDFWMAGGQSFGAYLEAIEVKQSGLSDAPFALE